MNPRVLLRTEGAVVFAAASIWVGISALSWVALVWTAHIGIDRAVGYGLQYPTEFEYAHLSAEDRRDEPVVEAVTPALSDD